MSSDDTVPQLAALLRASLVTTVKADALLANLVDVAGGLDGAIVFTDENVRSFGIEVELASTDDFLPRRMSVLTSGITGSKALARAVLGRPGALRTGYAVGREGRSGTGLRGRMAILEQRGPATLAEDLEAAAAIALSPAACEAVSGRLRALTGGDDGLRERVLRTVGMTGPEGHDTILELGAQSMGTLTERLGEVAPAFELEAEQIRALGAIHDALLAFEPPWVRISATPAAVMPGVTIAYAGQTLEHALRVIGMLATRPDAMASFGSFLEATGNDKVATVEIVVRPHEAIGARLGVALRL